jgi:PTS system nitrogen regulatory IIA component
VSLGALVRPDLIFPDVPAAEGPELLRAFAERMAARGVVRSGEELFQGFWEREQQGSTAIGAGVAIPHCKLPGLRRGVMAVGIVPSGVELAAADGEPVRLFFLVVSPDEAPAEHLVYDLLCEEEG